MAEEKNVGFVPLKPATSSNISTSSNICSNLFSNGAFDDVLSPMSELTQNFKLSKVKIARRRLTLPSDGNVPTPDRSSSDECSFDSGTNSPLLTDCPDVDSPIINYIRSKNVDIRRKCSARSFSSPPPSKKLGRKIKQKLRWLINDKVEMQVRSSSPSSSSDVPEKCPTVVSKLDLESSVDGQVESDTEDSVIKRKPLTPLNLFHNNNTSSSSPVFKPVVTQNCDVITQNCDVTTAAEEYMMEEKHSDVSMCEMADNVPEFTEDFRIKRRNFVKRPRPRSAPTVNMSFEGEAYDVSSGEAGEDDRFFGGDLLKCSGERSNMSPSCPSTFFELVDAPMVQSRRNKVEFTEEDKENFSPCKDSSPDNHVFQKPTGLPFKQRSISCSVKRIGDSPKRLSSKKQKTKCGRSQSFFEGNPALVPIKPMCCLKEKGVNSPRTLQRSQSFDLHNMKSGNIDVTDVDMDDKSLTGDKSQQYLLPTTASKHPDLKGINCDTMVDVLNGRYNDEISEYIIVDCRYPYEFEGGHIRGAINITDKEGMIDFFLKNPHPKTEKRKIVIFHCEFSSKRGPAMSRFLRNKDRDVHLYCYPTLYYPELYLLEGGYREFYQQKKEYCEPQGYREMSDEKFQLELRLFSRRSKSWSEDNNLRKRTSLRY